MDDPRLAAFAPFLYEQEMTPGYGDTYLFLVGRDNTHGIMHYLFQHEKLAHKFNQFGYDDEELNADIVKQIEDPNMRVQGTLDYLSTKGVHERTILAHDLANDPDFFNSITPGTSATGDISHTKGGINIGLGIAYEGSMNWSSSGEGIGISLDPNVKPAAGYKAQNNTLVLTTNPVFIARFGARLDAEHSVALQQQARRATNA